MGWLTVPLIIAAIVISLLVNNYKSDQCEHNGLGKWHYWTQICEPLPYPHNG
jgi:hypothetical protein